MPSSPSTGAHLGPTEDPPLLAVHHDLNLAAVTCFSGRKPDRQAREHPPPASSLFRGAPTARLMTLGGLSPANHSKITEFDYFEIEGLWPPVSHLWSLLAYKATSHLRRKHHDLTSRQL
jgi:hypothetical protein